MFDNDSTLKSEWDDARFTLKQPQLHTGQHDRYVPLAVIRDHGGGAVHSINSRNAAHLDALRVMSVDGAQSTMEDRCKEGGDLLT